MIDRIGPFGPGAARTLRISGNALEADCTVDLWRDFKRESSLRFLGLRRLKALFQAARSFPDTEVVHFSGAGARWALYFCFAPDGEPRAYHRFTVERLRAEGFSILVVCATSDRAQARRFLHLGLDALVWKALRGYDFSGYTAGLQLLAKYFDAVDVLVLNDSVLGPLQPIRPYTDSSPWGLTGFITSFHVEHHIISFAFYLKNFGRKSFRPIQRVFFPYISFNTQGPVSLLQETRLASSLADRISVGSLLTPSDECRGHYYMLGNPRGLLDAGFPFFKRSIFTKFADDFDQAFYRGCLEARGHPDVDACLREQ